MLKKARKSRKYESTLTLEWSLKVFVALGAEGTRVNAISAGPIRTLAASGINDFKAMLNKAQDTSPLKRNITIEEVGNAAAFMCSDLASGITGEITYVDCGYNIAGLASS